jgi:hypothetical protein
MLLYRRRIGRWSDRALIVLFLLALSLPLVGFFQGWKSSMNGLVMPRLQSPMNGRAECVTKINHGLRKANLVRPEIYRYASFDKTKGGEAGGEVKPARLFSFGLKVCA